MLQKRGARRSDEEIASDNDEGRRMGFDPGKVLSQ